MSDKYVQMPESLTAENGAKRLLIGEFKEIIELHCNDCHGGTGEFFDDCSTCGGSDFISQEVPVQWITIKEIYAMAVKELATHNQQE